ncbi:MAG: DNA replication and repair protein RecF [Puniceicoccaceae bacterium]|nr:MAG: DNA replication and repair protein RecF [Puniceicoccaceae bacterium]
MKLQAIALENFRNIALQEVRPKGCGVFFLGPNGQGKTNLLEALAYASILRSFRGGGPDALIRHGEKEAALRLELDHEVLGRTEVGIRIRPGGRSATCDGEPVRRLGEMLGRFPTVVLASGDILLVRGGPALRRRFLDLVLSSADHGYLAALQRYHRCLQERNAWLKGDRPRPGDAVAAAFEAQLIPAALAVTRKRKAGLVRLEASLGPLHLRFSPGVGPVGLRFLPDVAAETEEAYRELLEKSFERDRILRATRRGPHRDDFAFEIDGRPADEIASEGQQRGLVVALRFAELACLREATGIIPLILADDVLGELDPRRRALFWENLPGEAQVLATGTALPEGGLPAGHRLFEVREGRFEPANG